MSSNDPNSIFFSDEQASIGYGEPSTTDDNDEFDFTLPSLSLTEVDDVEERPEYKLIPANTVTGFEIYEAKFAKSANKGTPFWDLTLRTLEDTWGPNKQLYTQIYITEGTMKWSVKPFLTAVGKLDDLPGGKLTKEFVRNAEQFEGLRVAARVRGYKWTRVDAEGNRHYEQSFGRADQRKPVPSQAQLDAWGTRLREVVENFKPYTEPSGEGLSVFSQDDFI